MGYDNNRSIALYKWGKDKPIEKMRVGVDKGHSDDVYQLLDWSDASVPRLLECVPPRAATSTEREESRCLRTRCLQCRLRSLAQV